MLLRYQVFVLFLTGGGVAIGTQGLDILYKCVVSPPPIPSRIFLCSPGWSRMVDLLPPPPSTEITGMCHLACAACVLEDLLGQSLNYEPVSVLSTPVVNVSFTTRYGVGRVIGEGPRHM